MNRPVGAIESAIPLKPTSHPPKLPFVLSVGITGHRIEALAEDAVEAMADRLRSALIELKRGAIDLHRREEAIFAESPPRLLFVSPLADGADQIAAEIALELGFELQAVLPFDRETYRTTLHNSGLIRFDQLIARAACALELPGALDDQIKAFVMAGRATVAQCDILVALWDGLPPRGRGGTGEVVQIAITRGKAIAHIHIDAAKPSRLLWAAFDPAVLTEADEPTAERPLDRENVDALLGALLLPPPDPEDREFARRFSRERLRRIRARIEYPLLLAATGVGRFGTKDIANVHCERMIRDEWQRYRKGCADAHQIAAAMDILEESYSWADRLATHFAQTYRSGHIFNFVLGSIAVCLGLSAFMAPHLKLEFAAMELMITFAIILNAKIGSRNEWHRRWLDYRQLAERLRPMRSLKLLGLAAPDSPGTATNPVPRRWLDWYASGIWRTMGCVAGSIDRCRAEQLASAIAEHEIMPQVAYHRRNSAQIHKLDHRLGVVGFVLFIATLVVSVATILGMAFDAVWVNSLGNWLTLVSAGFPALGTAIFGIRFQADFGGDAIRSQSAANSLQHIGEELRSGVPLARAADLTEQAARLMIDHLDEWRLINQQRDLSVG
ncbi:MAG TPA: hypothetical protein VFP53_03215 [Sphingomicrobium sp.]|nr:hypothetical protein [Sphingomicrobium sp.]